MDFSELVASSPWDCVDRPAGEGLHAVLDAFLELHRQERLQVIIPPQGGEYRISEFAHPWPEIFFQITGERSFKFPSGEIIVVKPGQMAIIPRGVEHHERVVDLGAGHSCLVWMCLPGRVDLHVAVRAADGTQRRVCCDAFADYGAGGDHLCDEFHALTDEETRGYLTGLLLAHARQATRGISLFADCHAPLVDQCLRQLSFQLHIQDLSVASLAHDLRCSTSHLSRLFKSVMGETLVGYIVRRRVELAEDLLLEGRTPVAAVAKACGFSDASYFSRVYSKLKGSTPVMTRKKVDQTTRF
jgi:AraC-like DNA-binding protein